MTPLPRQTAKPLHLEDQVIIITGAARGLGLAYARLFAARGARVVVNDLGVARDGSASAADPAQEAAEAIRQNGGQAIAEASDIATAEGAGAVVQAALRKWNRIDAVVNNAGIFLGQRPFLETTWEDFLRLTHVHLGGTYRLCQAILPIFLQKGEGRIVNSCSIQGLYGAPTSTEYASAKGAVQSLTLSLAAATRGTAIRVNAISPGGFTRMVSGEERSPDFTKMLQDALDPDLAAPVAFWLCHPACTLHGQIIQAYAGRVSRTVIGEVPGFWDLALTPESAAAWLELPGEDSPLWHAGSSAAMAQRVLSEATERRRTAQNASC